MRILILGANQRSKYNRGHQLFKDEVARQSNVRFYGEGHPAWSIKRTHLKQITACLQFKPDLILTYMGKYCRWAEGLAETSIPKVHVVIDYFHWNYGEEDAFIRKSRPDLVLAVCGHEVRALHRNLQTFAKFRHLPFAVDTEFFSLPPTPERLFDTASVFSVVQWAYPTRREILAVLQRLKCTGVISESWPKTRVSPETYVRALQAARFAVNGVDVRRSLNWKFLEGPACGTLLITEAAGDMALLGFVHGENCVVFSGMKDLADKVLFFRSHDAEREAIAAAGARLVRSRHGLVTRVQEMFALIEEELGVSDGKTGFSEGDGR